MVNNWTGNGVFKLQRELQQDIQAGKISRLQDCDTNSDMANTWTGNRAPHTTPAASAYGAHSKWPSIAPFHNKSNMVNIGTKRWAPYTAAAPDQVVQDHNRGTKRQVGDALLWKRVPPEPDEPHTKVTKQGKWMHWCPHHQLWTLHKPDKCKIQPDPDRDQGVASKGARKENF